MPRQVLLIEPNTSGHRLIYVGLLAEAAAAQGSHVTIVLSADPASVRAAAMRLSHLPTECAIVHAEDLSLSGIEALSCHYRANTTIVPDGDHVAIEVGRNAAWNGYGKLTLLIMRRYAQPSRIPLMRHLRQVAKTALLNRAGKVPGVTVVTLRSGHVVDQACSCRFASAPDPITMFATAETAARFRKAHGLCGDRYWFAILGAVTPRKNLPLVAKALATGAPTRTGLLVAGVCDPVTLAKAWRPLEDFRARGGRVVVVNRLLSDCDLDSAVRGVDCVVLAHSNEGPSGLFGKSLLAGTRIVAAGASSLRQDVASVGTGAAWCALTRRSLCAALLASVERPRPECRPAVDTAYFTDVLLK